MVKDTEQSIESMSQSDLVSHKETIKKRLNEISLPNLPNSKDRKDRKKNGTKSASSGDKTNSNSTPEGDIIRKQPKKEIHWDFVMKEMMWLAADFQSERKRQISNGKKVAGAIKQFHNTKESRRLQKIAEAEAKRRRLAAKLGRDVKTWWTKIEKIITFKQKLQADELKQKRMDKHLVYLVKQTERYTKKLNEQLVTGKSTDDKANYALSPHKITRSKRNAYHKYVPYSTQTIEQALTIRTELPIKGRKNKARKNTSKGNVKSIELIPDDVRSFSTKSKTNVNRRVTFDLNRNKNDKMELENVDETNGMNIKELFLKPYNDDDISDESLDFDSDENDILDDETTLEAEERLGREMTYEEELELLKKEAELSVEEIRAKYTSNSSLSSNPAHSNRIDEVEKKRDPISNKSQKDKVLQIDSNNKQIANDANQRNTEINGNHDVDLTSDTNEVKKTKKTERNEFKSKRRRRRNSNKSEQYQTFISSSLGNDQDDEEFEHARDQFEMDDETTIEIEEKMGREMSHEEEISLLEKESEIPIEQLQAMYAKMQQQELESIEATESESDNSDNIKKESLHSSINHSSMFSSATNDPIENEDFHLDNCVEVDDETTLEAEEKLGREMSHEDEIAMLKEQSEVPIEELLEMYKRMEQANEKENGTENSSVNTEFEENFDKESKLFEDDHTEEEEFRPNSKIAIDDETTIELEEKLGREMSYEEELNHLKRESEMSIEELRDMYLRASEDEHSEPNSKLQKESGFKKRKRGFDSVQNNDERISKNETKQKKNKKIKQMQEEKKTNSMQIHRDPDDETNDTTVSRPYLLASWVKLRKYQQIGLNWLVSIQSRRLNGILADEMGLGKTLQTISLFSYLASYKGIWGPHLIIVPTSCIVNWEVELKRFCPALKVLCYHGSAKRRKELRQGWTKSNWYHVVITSYQLAVQDAFAFKRKRWYYLVLDEAHNIKNFQSQRWQTLITFNTQRRLLLTGTPLQNNLMELWSLLHFLMPHIFRSRKEFSYWFSNPMSHIIEGNANRNEDLIGRLHGIIRPFVLRRLKKDVETQMPGKFEHIVKCQLSRRQMFLYEEFISRSSTRQTLKKGGNFMGMMNVLMQLRKVCNHPDLFEPRSVITPFCMEPLKFTTAKCTIDATASNSSFGHLSEYFIKPLWTIGCGVSCFHTSTFHNSVKSEQFRQLQVPEEQMLNMISDDLISEPKPNRDTKPYLLNILSKNWKKAKENKEILIKRNARINSWRCQTKPFLYNDRLIKSIEITKSPLLQYQEESKMYNAISSTPKELLEMRKSQHERAKDMDEIIDKFVFCVPKAGSKNVILDANSTRVSEALQETQFNSDLLTPIKTQLLASRNVEARLSSFFPDKKLIQFDAGKLQTLATLLRELKHGGHRCLIFTQMSKMLDILEAFLNLNGHTYVRLDGSTGVDARQRLMDRFNSDTKIFCFILSTRSGGLGINLTGADTVIFYDSDWNPAMDAQAQDRAHRIGQTRDVHIYRLVTEHSIEENILTKAKQKRQLDLLVMDEGQFFASGNTTKSKEASSNTGKGNEVFTKKGLRDILGANPLEDDVSVTASVQSSRNKNNDDDSDPILDKEQMENAMAKLEDEDDVKAMRGAQKEAAEELKEFDENQQYQKDDNDSISKCSQDDETIDDELSRQSGGSKDKKSISKKNRAVNASATESSPKQGKENTDSKSNDTEMEKEFAAWQKKVGLNINTLTSSLKPNERYGIHFREEIDPFYSSHYELIYEELMKDGENDEENEFDVGEIEEAKEAEERKAMDDGDLLATNPLPDILLEQRQIYIKEKASLRAEKKRRKLTGENWCTKIDGVTKYPFWYNEDTGEAIWEKPKLLIELEADQVASEKRWSALSYKPLLHIMKFLLPYPDRIQCGSVSRHWRLCANDISFVKHIYPVELGALTMDQTKLDAGHFTTLNDAVKAALPGDTLELGDGHYWVQEPGLLIDFPLRIIGDENDPSHVVLELSGSIVWKGLRGWMEGVTLRRPKMASGTSAGKEILRVEGNGQIDMAYCVLDNEGGDGDVVRLRGTGMKGKWLDVVLKNASGEFNGLKIEDSAGIELVECKVKDNQGNGISCEGKSVVKLSKSSIIGNIGYGIAIDTETSVEIDDSTKFDKNFKGVSSNSLKDPTPSFNAPILDSKKASLPDEISSSRPRTRSKIASTIRDYDSSPLIKKE